jgi:hypothetical protein
MHILEVHMVADFANFGQISFAASKTVPQFSIFGLNSKISMYER